MTYSASDALNWSTGGVLKLLRRMYDAADACPICHQWKDIGHEPECELGWTIKKLEHEVLDEPGTPSRTFEPRPALPADLTITRSEGPTNNGAGDSLAGARSEAAG